MKKPQNNDPRDARSTNAFYYRMLADDETSANLVVRWDAMRRHQQKCQAETLSDEVVLGLVVACVHTAAIAASIPARDDRDLAAKRKLAAFYETQPGTHMGRMIAAAIVADLEAMMPRPFISAD